MCDQQRTTDPFLVPWECRLDRRREWSVRPMPSRPYGVWPDGASFPLEENARTVPLFASERLCAAHSVPRDERGKSMSKEPAVVGAHKCLSGYTVVDLTQYLSGPFCTMILGALGADVIKVEPVGVGDGNRHQPPFATSEGLAPTQTSADDVGLAFLKRNPGKRSIGIDLKDERGRRIFRDLVGRADAVVHNFRPGVAQRLGADRESLMRVNADLVYCKVEGLGHYASDGDERGVVDIVGQALSGIMAVTGQEGGPPTRVAVPIADQVAGLFAAIAVLGALLHRDGGRGAGSVSEVSVSMLSALSTLVWDEHLDVYHRNGLPPRAGNGTPRIVPFNTYLTADGRWIAISGVSVQEWRRLRELVPAFRDRNEWDELAVRVGEREEVDRLLSDWVRGRTSERLMAEMTAAGVTAAPVYGPEDILQDERFKDMVLYEVQHPLYGGTGAYGARFPIIVNGEQAGPYDRAAPLLNEGARDLLAEYSALSDAEIERLEQDGVIGGAPPA